MKHLKELPPFQYFGSVDSQDIDLVFFVESLPPTIADCAALCADFSEQYEALFYVDKKINSNLAILENEVLIDAFKGNTDELNNALFATYHLHSQAYPNHIERLLPRDLDLKFLRAARSILSLLTKTDKRAESKIALRGDIQLKMNTLETIDLTKVDWSNSKTDIVDIKKILAFQIGQSLALFCEKEVYTKREIGLIFPQLNPYLNRELTTDFEDLQSHLIHFINALKSIIPTIKSGFDYKYSLSTDYAD
jgi:hypothetical protein